MQVFSDQCTETKNTVNRRGIWRRIEQFFRGETGTATVESVIILPIILFALQGTFAFYESYHRQSRALKANYAISDYLSRFPTYDSATLEGLDGLLQYMTQTGGESWVRITVVECTLDCSDEAVRELSLVNSNASSSNSSVPAHTEQTMRTALGPNIPQMYQGQHLVVVETLAQFQPTFAERWTGIGNRDFTNIVVTSPRETDSLCWQSCDSNVNQRQRRRLPPRRWVW